MGKNTDRIQRRFREYWLQFVFRIVVLFLVTGLALYDPRELEILEGMNFFSRFSLLHLLWLLWVWYMLEKLLPTSFRQHKGSLKYRKSQFVPTEEYLTRCGHESQWEAYVKQKKVYARGARLVLGLWALVGVCIFLLKRKQIFGTRELLIASALFYVCDMVCILIWCPFQRLIMKNWCCTQCRIYNWDTWMMILPVAFVKGFFSYSLVGLALTAVIVWEVNHIVHPERYYPITNANLQCVNCDGEPGCRKLRLQKRFWWFIR